MIQKITKEMVPYDILIQTLCKLPYYGHGKGCINHGKKKGCPPRKTIEEYFNLNKELFVIYTEYKVGEFAEKMRIRHPEWTEKEYPDEQARRKEHILEEILNKLRAKHPDWPEIYYQKKTTSTWNSSRQWYNPRRWQQTARKQHEKELKKLRKEGITINRCPEALGINITGLMANIGIKLNWQWPPEHNKENKTYIISIAGYKK